MTVGLLLITHNNIGAEILKSAQGIVRQTPLQTQSVAIASNCIPEDEFHHLENTISTLDSGQGVLILTDLFGATPCNIARRLLDDNTHLVTGLNLAMLIRVMNYPNLSLDALVEKAVSAGHDSILHYQPD